MLSISNLSFSLCGLGGGGKVEHLGGAGVEVEHLGLMGMPNCQVVRIFAVVCVMSHVYQMYVVLVGSNTGAIPMPRHMHLCYM